jgi:hypothetical protein
MFPAGELSFLLFIFLNWSLFWYASHLLEFCVLSAPILDIQFAFFNNPTVNAALELFMNLNDQKVSMTKIIGRSMIWQLIKLTCGSKKAHKSKRLGLQVDKFHFHYNFFNQTLKWSILISVNHIALSCLASIHFICFNLIN